MKNHIKFIIEMWKNKRYRSLFILAIYIIFFIIVIIAFQPKQNEVIIQKTFLEEFRDLKIDNYKLKYQDKNSEKFNYVIIRNQSGNYSIFNSFNEKLVEDDNLYNYIINYNNQKIYNLISSSKLSSKNQNYDSGTVEHIYKLNNDKKESFNIDKNVELTIKVLEKNRDVISISLDFSDNELIKEKLEFIYKELR